MARNMVPVSVSPETKVRLEALEGALRACTAPTAKSAINRSSICHLAIRELMERYEKNPKALARKLGLMTIKG